MLVRVMFEVLIGVARFTRSTALLLSSLSYHGCTEKPVWEDKGQRILSHQHLLSELRVVGGKKKKRRCA